MTAPVQHRPAHHAGRARARRPPAGRGWKVWRATVGVFYLAAAAFNLAYTLPRAGEPELFEGYADGAWLPLFENLVRDVFMPNAEVFMVLVAAFEVAVGLAILGKEPWVDGGVAASVAWVIVLLPFLAWPYLLVNVGLAAAQGSIAARRYQRAAWDAVHRRAAHR